MIWALAAMAAPSTAGLQAQVHPAGLELLSAEVGGLSIEVGPLDLAADLSCYAITVDDFNLEVTVDDLQLAATSAGLEVDVQLHARGTYIDIAGASGWFDTCIDFARLIELIEVSDARLQGTLTARVVDGELALAFAAPPTVTGHVRSDADWFPDTLVWSWLEGTVLDQASTQLEAQLPGLVANLTSEAFLVDPLGTAPIALSVGGARVDADGLYAAVDIDLGGAGSQGRTLDLAPRAGSHFAIGLTEGLAQGALGYGWEQGLIDPSNPANQALVQSLVDGLDLGADLDIDLTLAGAPTVRVSPEGTRLGLVGLDLRVRGGGDELVHLVADLEASLDVTVDRGSLALSAHDVRIDVQTLDADGVLARDDADEDLAAFLEGWVASAASVWVQGLPVYQSRIEALGYVLEVTEVEAQDRGLAVWGKLHDADDASIDRAAPETRLDASVQDATIQATFSADEADVDYSWRLDGGGWSGWSTATTAEIAATPGDHTLEVRARDGWLNIDESPAAATLTLKAPESAPSKGCHTAAGPLGALWFVLPLWALRTRRP